MLTSLAPARRRLVLAVVVVLVVAVAVGIVLVRGGSTIEPVAQDQPGPVLLVPGYGGSTDNLRVLAQQLRAAGRDATVVDLPGEATGDLTEQAGVLDDAVDAVLGRTGASSVDVVAYSAGGVVARIWARDLDGAERARRIVTLGSPHHGTQLAGLAAGLALQGPCPAACQQLSPDSAVLSRVNAGDETPDGPEWVSVWTTADQVVTPPESARLDGALNLPVQDVCPRSTVDHSTLPRDPAVGAIVLAQLGPGPTVELTAADCATLTVD